MDEKFTAFCGLCCMDCIPSNYGFFRLVNNLGEILSELQFDEYAILKAEKNPVFEEYPTFIKVLNEIELLKCSGTCREGGGKPECEIRNCVFGKGYSGCWECRDRHTCTKLDSLRVIHLNLDYHLDLIGKYGPKNWFLKRKAHYRWQKENSE
ncbi:MAG: hypothetical protein QG646_4445 [Euryarchaeota archaeon]|nr:hypothetical protein [Euryarchaeota archaeon]